MNRRKAITRVLLIGAGATAAVGGYKWYSINREPDLDFMDQQTELIAALAETIIPATDTPGAKACQVEKYIQVMVRDCTDRKSQNKFVDGLKDLKAYTSYEYGKEYQHCTAEQQIKVLEHFAGKASSTGLWSKIERRYLGNSFFTTLKQYTVEGFCTSRQGATQALSYLHVPGRYQGCMPMTPGQKAWATS
ncbi:MAG: gluconate 2-dehydrogenase subunit 3 family protein [Sphingobacteriales bacterium]|nr:gluconate 2-dehydrogenase subunit 3 family protein [Sphingobacteriales bacterium]OJW03993.1 MAG: hypothetical protein BGO52_17790 [Sphingobacteriales bacterium 44-61]